MKKIILPIILFVTICFPNSPKAIACTGKDIAQFKEAAEQVKMDVEHDKNILLDQGDFDLLKGRRTKGVYNIKFSNIPENFQIAVYNDVNTQIFDSSTPEISGFIGGIYNVRFSNTNCLNETIKSFSFYLPTYAGGNNKNVWDDGTIVSVEESSYKISTSIILMLFLIVILIILGLLIMIIIKKKRGGIIEKNEKDM